LDAIKKPPFTLFSAGCSSYLPISILLNMFSSFCEIIAFLFDWSFLYLSIEGGSEDVKALHSLYLNFLIYKIRGQLINFTYCCHLKIYTGKLERGNFEEWKLKGIANQTSSSGKDSPN
jgi:hypothetical protein